MCPVLSQDKVFQGVGELEEETKKPLETGPASAPVPHP